MLQQSADLLKRNISYFASKGSNLYDYVESTTHNYDGHEDLSAFYVMSNVNIGSEITFIPGVRYQNLQTTYTAPRGITTSDALSYNHYDTTVVQNHGYWLPDVVLRYKPLSWFDVRLSYTNTLSYPDYTSIVPRINLSSTSISWLDYKLKPSRSSNYDLYLSFYDNTIGLFTIGGFLKRIDNLIYSKDFYVKGAAVLQYMPFAVKSTYVPNTSYKISTKVNDPYRINDYGMEVDWQTHFWYLPGPLSGLVFSANYTHIFSKAEYPNTLTVTTVRTITHIDTSYKDRLIDQPDDIINLSLGFDYQDFSIRVSMLYQSDIFTGANFWAQLRSHTSAYRRWDLSAKQELPWFGIQVYGDVNNINGANDVSVIQATTGVPTSEQDYGLSADFGIRLKL
jgi:TonB-dependent receptor